VRVVEYVVLFDEGVRKRHCHRSDKGKILEFVVQLEVLFEGKWKPVVRYDCAHDFAHIDIYNPRGKKRRSSLLLNFDEALVVADEDIRENWEKYVREFLHGR